MWYTNTQNMLFLCVVDCLPCRQPRYTCAHPTVTRTSVHMCACILGPPLRAPAATLVALAASCIRAYVQQDATGSLGTTPPSLSLPLSRSRSLSVALTWSLTTARARAYSPSTHTHTHTHKEPCHLPEEKEGSAADTTAHAPELGWPSVREYLPADSDKIERKSKWYRLRRHIPQYGEA